MNGPIYVALDTTDLGPRQGDRARVRTHVGGLKLGLEFFAANGPAGVRAMAELGLPIFLDLKLHDIPNTVAKAIQALRPLEPAILTVHAAGGRAMMEDAKAAAPSGTKVVAVTVLTSLDEDDLDVDRRRRRARTSRSCASTALAREAGLDGIVCSGAEVAAAKKAWPDGFFVVPGVRPADGRGRRPEARRHAAPGARRRRLDPGHRPPDHPGRGSRRRRPRHRRDALAYSLVIPARAGSSLFLIGQREANRFAGCAELALEWRLIRRDGHRRARPYPLARGAFDELAEPGPRRDPLPAEARDARQSLAQMPGMRGDGLLQGI